MTEQLNIISIFCNVFLDGIDHSKKADSEQIVLRNHVNNLFNIAFKYIGQTNRIILVNGNGAAIAYAGPAEDAMLMAKDILNGILSANKQGSAPLSVCIGVHLEPVRVVNDFNEQANIIGNGINAAKQMTSLAKPNEILVSRPYYENIPPSIQALSTLFEGSGVKYENHVLDYQAYLAGLKQDQVSENEPSALDQPFTSIHSLQSAEKSGFLSASSWKYALASLFILVTLFAAVKLALAPQETPNKKLKTLPLQASQSSNPRTLPIEPEIPLQKANVDDKDSVSVQEKLEPTAQVKATLMQEELELTKPVRATPAKKEVKQKTKSRIDSTSKKSKAKQIISWESLKNSIKQGQKNECTQAEIALNQCR